MHSAATVDELEAKALTLSEADRARLVGTLVRSLTGEDEIAAVWLDEAEARDREMGEDPDAGVPAGDVLRRTRARLA